MNFDIFCSRLKLLRINNNLTLAQLGNHIGSTKATISNLENGNKKPSLEIINAIAEYFSVSLDYLTGRTDDPDISNENKKLILSTEETELLEDFRLLNKHEQNVIIGKISEFIYNKNIENNNVEVSEELIKIDFINRLNK